MIEIWEHTYDRMIKTNSNFKNITEQCNIEFNLYPRDSFNGCRTNALHLFHQCEKGEEIRYNDFTSLYPWVQKYCELPVGPPEIIRENFKDINEYFRLVKCKVIPPSSLYIPNLPYTCNTKLLFPLCAKCAEFE